MLRTNLINQINTGRVWAFVGAGVSSDSGYLSWGSLESRAVEKLGLTENLKGDPVYQSALKEGNLAKCFSRIERRIKPFCGFEGSCLY